MHSGYGEGLGGMTVWWWAFRVLLIAGVVWFIAWFIAKRAGGRATGEADTPEMILERRYTRGEIRRDEHERRLNDLRK